MVMLFSGNDKERATITDSSYNRIQIWISRALSFKSGHNFNSFRIISFVLILCSFPLEESYAQPRWVKSLVREAANLEAPEEAPAIRVYDVTEVEILTIPTKAIFRKGQVEAKTKVRIAYKILSSEGEVFGVLSIPISPLHKVKRMGS